MFTGESKVVGKVFLDSPTQSSMLLADFYASNYINSLPHNTQPTEVQHSTVGTLVITHPLHATQPIEVQHSTVGTLAIIHPLV